MADFGHNGGPPIDDAAGVGWVRLERSIRSHHIVGFGRFVSPADPERGFCYSRGEAWIDLIMECRYTAGTVNNRGRKMRIEAGQLLGAVSWLASRWNWTPKTVRVFLDQLESDGIIERGNAELVRYQSEFMGSPDEVSSVSGSGEHKGKRNGKFKGNQSTIISLCNYDIYQIVANLQGQAQGQAQRQSAGQAKGNRGATEGQPRGNTLTKEQGNKGTTTTVKLDDGAREGAGEVGKDEAPLHPKVAHAAKLLAVLIGSETDPDHDRGLDLATGWASLFSPDDLFDGVLDYTAKRADRTERGPFTERRMLDFVRNAARLRSGVAALPAEVEKPAPKTIQPGQICEGMEINDAGKIVLSNGIRAEWMGKFGDDEKLLVLALDAARGSLQPNSPIPIQTQIESFLAKQCMGIHERSKNHRAQSERNHAIRNAATPTVERRSKWSAIAEEMDQNGGKP